MFFTKVQFKTKRIYSRDQWFCWRSITEGRINKIVMYVLFYFVNTVHGSLIKSISILVWILPLLVLPGYTSIYRDILCRTWVGIFFSFHSLFMSFSPSRIIHSRNGGSDWNVYSEGRDVYVFGVRTRLSTESETETEYRKWMGVLFTRR